RSPRPIRAASSRVPHPSGYRPAPVHPGDPVHTGRTAAGIEGGCVRAARRDGPSPTDPGECARPGGEKWHRETRRILRVEEFAVKSGSDSVAGLDVLSNGSPRHVKGSPFPSVGLNPVSVGLSKDDVLVVANKDYALGRPGFDLATQGSYTSFRVSPKGRLSFV